MTRFLPPRTEWGACPAAPPCLGLFGFLGLLAFFGVVGPTSAQQLNQATATLRTHGQEAGLADPVGRTIRVSPTASFDIEVVSEGNAGAPMIMLVSGVLSLGGTAWPIGSLDIGTPTGNGTLPSDVIVLGDAIGGSTGSALDQLLFTDSGDPANGVDPKLRLAVPGYNGGPLAVQFIVQDPTAPFGFSMTEAAVLVTDSNPHRATTEYEPGTHSMYAAAMRLAGESLDDNAYGRMSHVHPFSREVTLSETDMVIRGLGAEFEWRRTYRSRLGRNTELGNGWTHSWDIRVVANGNHVDLLDGEGRHDTYALQVDGTWMNPEFPRRLEIDAQNRHCVTFRNGSQWVFHPLDGMPHAGKIQLAIDRHSNMMQFGYDTLGRLESIIDTLGRTVLVNYDTGGRLSSIVDFAGRAVTYSHYVPGDLNGNAGDLKSATSPAVTGTPNGNDFPNGKTTTYEYATNTGSAALDGNLVTVIDPNGNTWMKNQYHSVTNPADPNHDRVSAHTLGNAGDVFHLVAVAVVPSAQNNYAVTKTIVNNRVGHVSEFYYDAQNRAVMWQQFTGSANPNQRTTETANRPTNRLRVTDPVFFETRSGYDGHSNLIRMVRPEGNVAVTRFRSADANVLARNSRSEVKLLPGPRLADQAEIVERFEYVDVAGAVLVSTYTDPRGNVRTIDYDANGNQKQVTTRESNVVENFEYDALGRMTAHVLPDNGSGHRRRDEYSYYTSGPSIGYLETIILDVGHASVVTTYEYDALGEVTKITDGRGNDTQYVRNQLGQVVRQISRPINGTGLRYEKDFHYDGNGRVVRRDVLNIDENGTIESDTHTTLMVQLDVHGRVTSRSEEVGFGVFVTTENVFDAEGNIILHRQGAAVDGTDPANTLAWEYDERGLIYKEIHAPGHAKQSTTVHDYSLNAFPSQTLTGIEDVARVTTYSYDGFDRLVGTVDPMGNAKTMRLDANGNVVNIVVQGELVDAPGSAGNVRLAEQTLVYDALDRVVETRDEHFDPASQTLLTDGQVVRQYVYNGASELIKSTNDDGATQERFFNTMGKPALLRDAGQNTWAATYDPNGNMLSMTETHVSDLGSAPQVFQRLFVYDGENRVTQCSDTAGNVVSFFWDSRDKVRREIDTRGIETRFIRDGLGRRIATVVDMNQNGANPTDPADIVTQMVWDASSRVTHRIDGNGNVTTTQYDPLGRPKCELHQDGSKFVIDWNAHDDPMSRLDPNGSEIVSAYDALGRRTMATMTPGPGVSGDLLVEVYAYDGQGMLVLAEDEDSVVEREFDSLFNMKSETLNGEKTTFTHTGEGGQARAVYPGGRVVDSTFDLLGRVSSVTDAGGLVTDYKYVGPDRVERRNHGNGTRVDYEYAGFGMNAPGDFGFKHNSRTLHSLPSQGTTIDDRVYTWDGSGNRQAMVDQTASVVQTTNYLHDAANRITLDQIVDSSGSVVSTEGYTYDAAFNRLTRDDNGIVANYTLDPTVPDPADFQVNQYTTTPDDARTYDANGNLIEVVGATIHRRYEYDVLDQMTTMIDVLVGDTWKYLYDPIGRRTAKMKLTSSRDIGGPRVDSGFGFRASVLSAEETYYFYDAYQVVEEQDVDGNTTASYVYGTTIDDVVNLQTPEGDFLLSRRRSAQRPRRHRQAWRHRRALCLRLPGSPVRHRRARRLGHGQPGRKLLPVRRTTLRSGIGPLLVP